MGMCWVEMKKDLKQMSRGCNVTGLRFLQNLEMFYYFCLTGSTQVDDCEDSFNLGDDVDFLSAMNDDKEGNKSDEVDFQCYTYIVILNLTQTCKAHTSVTKLICNHWCKLLHCTCKSCNTSVL